MGLSVSSIERMCAATSLSQLRDYSRACRPHAMQALRQLVLSRSLLSACARSVDVAAITGVCDLVADCQSSKAYLKHLTPTSAAAATARSFASDRQGSAGPADNRVDSGAETSSSQSVSGPDDDYLEEWAKLIEKGDLPGQAALMERVFGEDPEPIGPPLSELLNYDRKAEERAKRRMFELQKQEEIRQSRQATSKPSEVWLMWSKIWLMWPALRE